MTHYHLTFDRYARDIYAPSREAAEAYAEWEATEIDSAGGVDCKPCEKEGCDPSPFPVSDEFVAELFRHQEALRTIRVECDTMKATCPARGVECRTTADGRCDLPGKPFPLPTFEGLPCWRASDAYTKSMMAERHRHEETIRRLGRPL